MARYEFQSTLHRNMAEMADAIAEAWLTAGGSNTAADIAAALATTDAALAAECAGGFGLAAIPDSYDADAESHMAANGYDVADLAAAFGRYRARDAIRAGLVLCRSDQGDGGWSLHAPGATDEQIASGDAPALAEGDAEMDDDGEWNAPTAADYDAAARAYAARGI